MLDQSPELLVELEGLLAEGVQGILAAVAAEADAPPQVVELGEVLHPERIDRPQQDEPLDHRPVGLAHLGLARIQALVDKVSGGGDTRLTTGIFGTKFLLDVLSRGGRADLAAALVARTSFP